MVTKFLMLFWLLTYLLLVSCRRHKQIELYGVAVVSTATSRRGWSSVGGSIWLRAESSLFVCDPSTPLRLGPTRSVKRDLESQS